MYFGHFNRNENVRRIWSFTFAGRTEEKKKERKKSIDYSLHPLMQPNPSLSVRMLGVKHVHIEKFWAPGAAFLPLVMRCINLFLLSELMKQGDRCAWDLVCACVCLCVFVPLNLWLGLSVGLCDASGGTLWKGALCRGSVLLVGKACKPFSSTWGLQWRLWGCGLESTRGHSQYQ